MLMRLNSFYSNCFCKAVLTTFSFFIVAHSTIKAQNENGFFRIRNYTTKEYKAKAQNWAVVQDQRGLMYFGNNDGVLEFDGSRWKIIKTEKQAIVRSLAIDSKGRIYVGGTGEIGYLIADSAGQMKYRSLLNQLKEEDLDFADVWKTYTTANGDVYFQSSNKIFRWNGSKMKVWNAEKTFHLLFDVNDKLYLRQREIGLMSLKDSNFVLMQGGESYANELIYLMTPFNDREVLLNTRSQGLSVMENYSGSPLKVSPFKTEADDFFLKNLIYNGIPVGRHTSVGTLGGGIAVIDSSGTLINAVDKNTGLQDGTIFNQYEDKEKNLWLALNNGVSKVNISSSITLFDNQNGLEGTVQAIIRHSNKLYVATNLGVFYLDNEKQKDLSKITHARFKKLKNIDSECWGFLSFKSNSKDILFVTTNGGVIQIEGETSKKISDGNSNVLYQSITDPNRVFIGLADGVSSIYFRNGAWEEEGKIKDIDEDIRGVAEDKDGNIWLGSNGMGIIKLRLITKGEKITNTSVTKFNGTNQFFDANAYVSEVDGRIVFATDRGLYKLAENSMVQDTAFGKRYTDSTLAIYRVLQSQDKNIWMVTVKNDRIKIGYLKPGSANHNWQWIENPFNIISKEIIHAIYHDNGAVTWLGGPDGLYRYDGKIANNHNADYNTLIRNVYIGKDSLIFAGTYCDEQGIASLTQPEFLKPSIKFMYNSLIFEYSSASYESEADNVFSYYLEGFDKQWSGWKNETKAVYTNLPEGNYFFRVKSKNVFDKEGVEAVYEFTVLSPWYRTIWAYILYVMLSAGFVYGAITVSTRSLKAIIAERTAEVVKQKNEIEMKNKDITDSINYAKKIQEAILPANELFKSVIKDGFIVYKPKDIVSGDFYWMAEKEGSVLITAADCTGHGVPGAFMSMIGSALLNEIVNDKAITEPASILNHMRDGIVKALKQTGREGESKDGMDIALCNISFKENKLQYAGANNSLFIVRNKELLEFKANKFPIGIGIEMKPFTNNVIDLQANDIIYIFTDGYADQFGGRDGKKFMKKRFKDLFLSISDLVMDEQKIKITEAFKEWQGSYEQVDDVLVIGIRV